MTQVLACPGLFPFHFLTEKALWRAWTGQGYELLDGLLKYANVSLCFHPRCDFFVSSLYFVTMEFLREAISFHFPGGPTFLREKLSFILYNFTAKDFLVEWSKRGRYKQ